MLLSAFFYSAAPSFAQCHVKSWSLQMQIVWTSLRRLCEIPYTITSADNGDDR